MTNPTDAETDRTTPPRWKKYLYGLVAAEVSTTARYCDQLIQLCPLEHDHGLLLDAIECPAKALARQPEELADVSDDSAHRLMVLLNWDNDIGDGWEWAKIDRYGGLKAYKLGINYILYSLSH